MDFNGFSRRVIVFLLSCVLFSTATVHADQIQRLSVSHLRNGERFYAQRKDLKAADRFVRALLLEPASRPARERLQEVIQKSTVLTQHQRLQLQRFIDLVDYHQFLINRIEGLLDDSRQYSQQIDRLPASSQFSVELTKVTGQLDKIVDETEKYRQIWIPEDIPSRLPMETIFSKFDVAIQELEQQHKKLSGVCAELRQQHLAARKNPKGLAAHPSAKSGPSQSSPDAQPILTGRQNRIQDFRGELTTVKSEFEALQKKLEETNTRVEELTRNLASVFLELFEKEKVIADKDLQMSQLDEHLQETRERMSLVQRIIQEKDQQIQALQADMRNLQMHAGHSAGVGAQPVVGTASHPGDVDKLAALEKQLNELSDKYSFLVDKIQERDLAIAQLRGAVAEKNEQVNLVHKAVKTQEEEIGLLNGIIQIYQGRLVDLSSSLKEKEKEMNVLQRQLLELGASGPDSLKETAKVQPPDAPQADLAAQPERIKMNPVFLNGGRISSEDVLKETKENVMQLRDKRLPR